MKREVEKEAFDLEGREINDTKYVWKAIESRIVLCLFKIACNA